MTKKEAKLHKVRIIYNGKINSTYGVAIPSDFNRWFNTWVTIKESGNSLIIESGARPTPFTFKEMKREHEVLERIRI